MCGSLTHAASEVVAGAGGQGNCPVSVAVPDPVFGSEDTAGQLAGRRSTTPDGLGSVAWGRPVEPDGEAGVVEAPPVSPLGAALAAGARPVPRPAAVTKTMAPRRATLPDKRPAPGDHDRELRLEPNRPPSESPVPARARR